MAYIFIRLLAVVLLWLSTADGAAARDKIEIVPQIPHTDGVSSVVFSPDGRQVLSGSWDKTIKLWDAASGKLLRSFLGHSDEVRSVAFSPDGRQVLSGSQGDNDNTVKLWDAASGQLLRTFEGHSDGVNSVAFSPDGRQVLSGGNDNAVKLWDATTGNLVHNFAGHSSSSVAFSPDGRQVLSGSWDKTVRLWDVASGKLVHSFKGHSDAVNAVAFSPDGREVVAASDNTVKFWDAKSGRLVRNFEEQGVQSVVFSPDGGQVLLGGDTVKLWDVATRRLVRTFEGYPDAVHSVAFSPDGRQVLSAGTETFLLWDVPNGTPVRNFKGRSEGISSAVFSPDGRQMVSGSWDKTVRLWDASSAKLVRSFEGHSDAVSSVAFSSDGRKVLSGSLDNTIKLWDKASGRLERTFVGHSDGTLSVAFSPDGSRVLSGGWDDTIKLWDAPSGKLLRRLEVPSKGVNSVAFSPDGQQALSGNSDRAELWALASGKLKLVRSFKGHSGRVSSVAFSSDGRQVLSGSLDNTVKLWDAASGKLLRTFDGHSDMVSSVAFSPDEHLVSSGSRDKTIKLWDESNGRLLRTLEGHSDNVSSVAFSPDGRQVLSGSFDTTTRLWKTESGELLATMIASPDGEWLAITPVGFFAGSPKGSELISVVRGLKVYSAMQFFDALYRPDLVEELLKGDPNGRYKNAVAELSLEKILDSGEVPEIVLLEKKTVQAEGGGKVSLTVNIKSGGGGIGEKLIWRVNGITQGNPTPPELKGLANGPFAEATVTETLKVDPGQENIVEVTAYNGAGLLATLPLRITVDKFGATTTERPRMHVLAIGVNKYRMPEYQLNYAVNDADEFTKAMTAVSKGLFAGVDVTTLKDEKVTRDDIAAAFNQISTATKPGDVFVLFLSGHGVSVDGRYYYYPQNLDFAAGQNYQNGIGQDLWQEWLAKIPAQKTLLILDTCESGGASGIIKGASARETAMDQLQYATGQNLIAAAGSSEVAREGYKNHGVLTYALLEALSQQPKEGGEEKVKVGMLADYVEERVPDITQSVWGVPQRPVRRLTGSDFPIGFRTAGLLPAAGEDIPTQPTHVLIRNETVREMPAKDAPGGLTLDAGTQVRVIDLVGGFAKIARAGKKLGYVPKEAIAPLQ